MNYLVSVICYRNGMLPVWDDVIMWADGPRPMLTDIDAWRDYALRQFRARGDFLASPADRVVIVGFYSLGSE